MVHILLPRMICDAGNEDSFGQVNHEPENGSLVSVLELVQDGIYHGKGDGLAV